MLTTKEIAAQYTKRYGLNAAEAMENAAVDRNLAPQRGYPLNTIMHLNRYWDDMENFKEDK